MVKGILERKYKLKAVKDDTCFRANLRFSYMTMDDFIRTLEDALGYRLPYEIESKYIMGYDMTVGELINNVERHAKIQVMPPLQPTAGLYRVAGGKAICCLTDEKCRNISKTEVVQNANKLENLCAIHDCVIECNFKRLTQYTK